MCTHKGGEIGIYGNTLDRTERYKDKETNIQIWFFGNTMINLGDILKIYIIQI